jgi:hypothetical protein
VSQKCSFLYITQNPIGISAVRLYQTAGLAVGGTLCGTQETHVNTSIILVPLPRLEHDWLRHNAKSLKVADSIPDEIIAFFN